MRNEISFKIMLLKEKLKSYDYKTIKYIQGKISESEFEVIKNECESIRLQINELQENLNQESI